MKKFFVDLFIILLVAAHVYAAIDTFEGQAVDTNSTIEGVNTTDTIEGQALSTGGGGGNYTSQMRTLWLSDSNATPNPDEIGSRDLTWNGSSPAQDTSNKIEGTASFACGPAAHNDSLYRAGETGDFGYDYAGPYTLIITFRLTEQTADRGLYGFGSCNSDGALCIYYTNASDDIYSVVTTNGFNNAAELTTDANITATDFYMYAWQHDDNNDVVRDCIGRIGVDSNLTCQTTAFTGTVYFNTTANRFFGYSVDIPGGKPFEGNLDVIGESVGNWTDTELQDIFDNGIDGNGW